MMMIKRFLNVKSIALVAALLFIVACYFAARKVMVSGIELGMSRAEVRKVLGEPTEKVDFMHPGAVGDGWETVLFSSSVYRQSVVVAYDKHDKVDLILIFQDVFGRHFQQIKQ
ncbi:MAG: hypothetical protein QM703_10605 [Gemmatales bacterium]